MLPFDYVAVLLSIVISLSLTHLLSGIAAMIQNGIRNLSLPLVQWMGFCLFLCVDYWFSIWQAHERVDWSLQYVGLLLIQAAMIYIAAKLITPAVKDDEPIDMAEFYETTRPKFMITCLAMLAVGQVTNWTLPGFHSLPLVLIVGSWVVLLSSALVFKALRIQLAIAAANIALTIYYAVTYIPAL